MFSLLIHLIFVKSAFGCIVEERTARRDSTNGVPTLLKLNSANDSLTVLYGCSEKNHVSGKTYLEIRNFLHAYIANKKTMHPNLECRRECEDFSDTKIYDCGRNKWCKSQSPCAKINRCQFVHTQMEVCLGNMTRDNRRYEFVELENGRSLGVRRADCPSEDLFYLESQSRGLFDICHYCFCICDEGPTPNSDVFVSLRTVMSDVRNNRVVTGLRFVKHDRTIHFQVQEGELLSGGRIGFDTVRWVPVRRYRVNDRNVVEGVDYHKLSWEHRSLHLNYVLADKDSVVTGVRFRTLGSTLRLHLEIVVTPFNYSTGKLISPEVLTSYKTHPETTTTNKFAQELKLIEPDVPTRMDNEEFTVDKFVKFRTSDYRKDAGQSTVPFYDARALTTREPLLGVGIFHRGGRGSGGFITPAVFPNRYLENL